MGSRVVVTGFGCLTASGMSAGSTWEAVRSGASGIAPPDDPRSSWPYPLAAEIKEYSPRKLVADRKLLKAIGKQDVLGLNAVAQALEHSGLLEHRDSLDEPARFFRRHGRTESALRGGIGLDPGIPGSGAYGRGRALHTGGHQEHQPGDDRHPRLHPSLEPRVEHPTSS